MARAAELSGDGFEAAKCETNAFFSSVGDEDLGTVLGDLDESCDALLFYGLAVRSVRPPKGQLLRIRQTGHSKDSACPKTDKSYTDQ